MSRRRVVLIFAFMFALSACVGCLWLYSAMRDQREQVHSLHQELEAMRVQTAKSDDTARGLNFLQSQVDALGGTKLLIPDRRGNLLPDLHDGNTDVSWELFVRHNGQLRLAMRYSGPTVAQAMLPGQNRLGPNEALSAVVQRDPNVATWGLIEIAEVHWVRPTGRLRRDELSNTRVGLVRPAADSEAWELQVESCSRLREGVGIFLK